MNLKIKENSKIRKEYEKFIATEEGKKWKENLTNKCEKEDIKDAGDFGDYLYDFYPELIS